MHLPNINPSKEEQWFEDEPEPSLESSYDKQGSEGELRESGYGSATGRCGWLKRHKWKVLLLVLALVVVIVLVAVLVPKGGGGDEGEPAQVSSTGNATGSTPTMSPAANETTKPPTAAPNESESGLAPSVLFSPAVYPAQAPFVFEQQPSGLVWNQFGEVSPEGQAVSLSSAVSGDGETVALMSRTKPGNSAISVSVYRFNGEWRKLGESIVGDGDISINGIGQSLALSHRGNILVIGFFNSACEAGENCGRVQVHTFRGEWQQIGTDVVGDEPNVMLGLSVAISANGKTIVAGAPYGNGADGLIHIGMVKVLRFVKSDWKLLGTDLIQGDEMRDQLGSSISLNEDGSIVACGATQGGMPGKIGYVKVAKYNESTDSFIEMGSHIAAREGLDEQMGLAIALSYNGTELAVSAFNTVGSGIV